MAMTQLSYSQTHTILKDIREQKWSSSMFRIVEILQKKDHPTLRETERNLQGFTHLRNCIWRTEEWVNSLDLATELPQRGSRWVKPHGIGDSQQPAL